MDRLGEHLTQRRLRGANHHLVVVAEGAKPYGGDHSLAQGIKASAGATERLGGAAERVAAGLAHLGLETRTLVLGHLQRGGSPTYRDRLLGTAFGAHALRLVERGDWGRMVCLQGRQISAVPLVDAISKPKCVQPDGDTVATARSIGVSFGD